MVIESITSSTSASVLGKSMPIDVHWDTLSAPTVAPPMQRSPCDRHNKSESEPAPWPTLLLYTTITTTTTTTPTRTHATHTPTHPLQWYTNMHTLLVHGKQTNNKCLLFSLWMCENVFYQSVAWNIGVGVRPACGMRILAVSVLGSIVYIL